MIARAKFEEGENDRAIADWTRAIGLSPRDPVDWADLLRGARSRFDR